MEGPQNLLETINELTGLEVKRDIPHVMVLSKASVYMHRQYSTTAQRASSRQSLLV
jgi:hypothetical protein